MNNARSNQLPQDLSLVSFNGARVVNPETYQRNREQVMRARAILENFERENEEAYTQYVQTVQELEEARERGRQAASILNQLQGPSQQQFSNTPPASVSMGQQSGYPTQYASAPPMTQGNARSTEFRDGQRANAHLMQMQEPGTGSHSAYPYHHHAHHHQPQGAQHPPSIHPPSAPMPQAHVQSSTQVKPDATRDNIVANDQYRYYGVYHPPIAHHPPPAHYSQGLSTSAGSVHQQQAGPTPTHGFMQANSIQRGNSTGSTTAVWQEHNIPYTRPADIAGASGRHVANAPVSAANSLVRGLSPHNNVESAALAQVAHPSQAPNESPMSPQQDATNLRRRRELESALRDIFNVMKDLNAEVADAVNKLAVQKLSATVTFPPGLLRLATFPPLDPAVESQAQLSATFVASRLQGLTSEEIVGALHYVNKKTRGNGHQSTPGIPPPLAPGGEASGPAAPLSAPAPGDTRVASGSSGPAQPLVAAVDARLSHTTDVPPREQPQAFSRPEVPPIQLEHTVGKEWAQSASGAPGAPVSGTSVHSPARSNASVGKRAQAFVERPVTPNGQNAVRHSAFTTAGHNFSAGQTVLRPSAFYPRTPAQADKSRLARDVLRALGRPSGPLSPSITPASTSAPSRAVVDMTRHSRPPLSSDGASGSQLPLAHDKINSDVPKIGDSPMPTARIPPVSDDIPPQAVDVLAKQNYDPPTVPVPNDTASAKSINLVVETPDITEVVEVYTPGVVEMAYNEAQYMLREHDGEPRSPPTDGEPRSPPTDGDAPQDAPSPPTSPMQRSVASFPPVSRSTTPPEDVRQDDPLSDDVPMHDSTNSDDPLLHPVTDNGAQDQPPSEPVPENLKAPSELVDPPVTPTSSPAVKPPTPRTMSGTDIPREPLFLSSPPGSPESVINHLLRTDTASEELDSFFPSDVLGVSTPSQNKGKGRARDSSSSEDDAMFSFAATVPVKKKQKVDHSDLDLGVVASSEPEEASAMFGSHSTSGRVRIVEVVIPKSELVERSKKREVSSISRNLHAHQRLSLKATKQRRIDSPESSEEDAVDGDGNLIPTKEDTARQSKRERDAVQLSSNRLYETLCEWGECDAVLESTERLGTHLQQHILDMNTEAASFACEWEECGRKFATKDHVKDHLRSHGESSLVCAYVGCSSVYPTPRALLAHHDDPKHRGKQLKPTASHKFWIPYPKPPEMPETLPAYMSVPMHITQACIPHDVHTKLGPKILANITCYVHPGTRQNAAKPSRKSRQIAEKIASIERAATDRGDDPAKAVLHFGGDEYDSWLECSSSRGPKYCDDLPSTDVTRMVEQGLVIGSEYLAGDMRWDPGNDDGGIEDASERTAVHENPIEDREPAASAQPDGAVGGLRAMAVDTEFAEIREPDADDANALTAGVQPPPPLRERSISHGHEQILDEDHDLDVDMALAETVSQPTWDFMRD